MPKTETTYARLELRAHDTSVSLVDSRMETNDRLFEVLDNEFFQIHLTNNLVKAFPDVFTTWKLYRENAANERPQHIRAVAKFEVTGQKVDLIDIRFY